MPPSSSFPFILTVFWPRSYQARCKKASTSTSAAMRQGVRKAAIGACHPLHSQRISTKVQSSASGSIHIHHTESLGERRMPIDIQPCEQQDRKPKPKL